MSNVPDNAFLRRSQRLYACLLVAYPTRHREEYGPAMQQVFRDQCRDAWRDARGWGLTMVWLRALLDLLKTSFVERLLTIQGNTMSHRFARFLGFHSNPRVLFLRTAVAVFLVVFGATAITALLTPKRFTSEARLLIRYVVDNPSDIPEASRTPSAEGLTKADQIMAGEMQLIQSDAVLQRVVRSQNLEMRGRRTNANSQKLATGEEVALLRGRLKVNVPPRSSVLQLRVNSEDASEAAKTAQAIVDAYLAARIEAIHELKTENLDRAAIAEERRRERERLREELNVLNIKIVQSPTPGDLLVRPYVPGRLLMGGAGGLFLALVLGIAVTLLAKERAPAKPEESPSSGASAAA